VKQSLKVDVGYTSVRERKSWRIFQPQNKTSATKKIQINHNHGSEHKHVDVKLHENWHPLPYFIDGGHLMFTHSTRRADKSLAL
jgi:hypothetical protein